MVCSTVQRLYRERSISFDNVQTSRILFIIIKFDLIPFIIWWHAILCKPCSGTVLYRLIPFKQALIIVEFNLIPFNIQWHAILFKHCLENFQYRLENIQHCSGNIQLRSGNSQHHSGNIQHRSSGEFAKLLRECIN